MKSSAIAAAWSLHLLAEGARQSREPAHRHPHRQVLALHVGRGDVLPIGIARHSLDLAADARGGAIARLTARLLRMVEALETPMLADEPSEREHRLRNRAPPFAGSDASRRVDVLPTVFRL
jgi:hypothetical protein